MELLNESLVSDLQSFIHHLDWATFRRLPTSRSEAGDVSVTTTCTGLMTLAIARERQAKSIWELTPSDCAQTVRDACSLLADLELKPNDKFEGRTRDKTLAAADSVWQAAALAEECVTEQTAAEVSELLCQCVDGLVKVSGDANKVVEKDDAIKGRLAFIIKAIKRAATKAAASATKCAEKIPEALGGGAGERATACKAAADGIQEVAGVEEVEKEGDARVGLRDCSGLRKAADKDKMHEILSLMGRLEWKSSQLEEDNAFTAAMFVRTCGLVSEHYEKKGEGYRDIKRKKDEFCSDTRPGRFNGKTVAKIAKFLLSSPETTLVVGKYPATSTLGYWLLDAVGELDLPMEEAEWRTIATWASNEFTRQATLVAARHDAMMDPIAMAMAACMLARLTKIAQAKRLRLAETDYKLFPSPAQLIHSIRELFQLQGGSGIWPKYFPLFHYPDAGANYCFSFEMLEAILSEFGPQEREDIEAFDVIEDQNILDGLERAVRWCEQNRFEYTVPDGTAYRGWNSGGQVQTLSRGMPESWATGVVHMFLFRLRGCLSRAIQRRLLRLYGVKSVGQRRPDPSDWNGLIDMSLNVQGVNWSLKDLIKRKIIDPLQKQGSRIVSGVRRSALLFGPPGTSKTSIVKAMAKLLGWPFLEINPAHFLNEGLERIYVRADEVFEDLMDLTGVVVLFDEMDALVQKRSADEGTTERLDVTRQFLTTSMLPKLSKLYDKAGTLFFMATNYQRQFDEAIKRPRRFDLLVCMAPPLWKDKLANIDIFLKAQYGKLKPDEKNKIADKLEKWAETGDLAEPLDRFSFDEMRVFLEHFLEGKPLDEVVADEENQKKFVREVKEWATKFITLREGTAVYKDYTESDIHASRIQ